MEALTRLVTDSLARHGFDRPVDPRRLQWSRWFRCDSPRSLLTVPSKPGIFALAEEVAAFGADSLQRREAHVGTDAFVRPAEQSSATACSTPTFGEREPHALDDVLGGAARCDASSKKKVALAAEDKLTKRMLAVLQFSEDDDMAFTLDRMFTRINPMRERLSSGKCFLRFVVIEDQAQRRSICSALNQWMLNSAEKATGIPSDFSSTLEVPNVGRTLLSDSAESTASHSPALPLKPTDAPAVMNSGAAKNLHCPQPLPSGF
jgi:hypothetical protein